MSKRYRNLMFTVWNVGSKLVFTSKMSYLVYQLEECPETKKLHYQGYMELKSSMSFSAITKMLKRQPSEVHYEARKGTAAEADAYCSKVDTRKDGPWREGTISKQGKRNDLGTVTDMVKKKARLSEIAENCPTVFLKYHNGIKSLMNIYDRPHNRARPSIVFLWGPPRCGKSRWVRDSLTDVYYATDSKEGWFDRYDGEDIVVFDEFRGLFPRYQMLQLLDYQPLSLPVKGGFVTVHATKFVFTSNVDPYELYCSDKAWIARLNEFGVFISDRSGGTVLPPTSAKDFFESLKTVSEVVPTVSEELPKVPEC